MVEKPLSIKPAVVQIENSFCVKKGEIFMSTNFYTPGCYTGKMLFAMENNASKIIRNWFFTVQPDILKLFTIYQIGQNKGHGRKFPTLILYL